MLLRQPAFATVLVAVMPAASVLFGAAPVGLPNGESVERVDFERHVAALLGRLGCNAGSCHGSFQGKGGFQLSLFGHSPEMDYRALTRGANGRRVDLHDPDGSLMLLKPTMQLAHEGGRRFPKDSWQYRVLRHWIAGGAKRQAGSGRVKQVEILPNRYVARQAGEEIQLKVMVEFADGARSDMTPFCAFRSHDDSVAEVSESGRVRTLYAGDTDVVVSYRGHLTTSRVLVPVTANKDRPWPKLDEANRIDQEVFAKLRELRIVPSEPSNDTDFLRRVTIDTIGQLPAPSDIRTFLSDKRPDKRSRKMDELLTHPLHAALWATRLCDITGNDLDALETPAELRPKRAKMWHDWFRHRIAENVGYDEIVRGVLCSTSREGKDIRTWISQEAEIIRSARDSFDTNYAERTSLDLYWRRNRTLEQMAEQTAAAFLGVRIQCAQCHKHPFDRWTQADYRSFANVFASIQFGSSPELRAAMVDILQQRREAAKHGRQSKPIPRLREVYRSRPRRFFRHPDSSEILEPKAPGGPVLPSEGDPREALFAWFVEPDNPFFARAFVNRVWAHYMGIGLVQPVDAFSIANPPSNQRLLDFLATDFVEHGYDIRRLERMIITSQTYQLSAFPNDTNLRDRRNFSRAYVRPLLAEVVLDVLNTALDVKEDFGEDAPPGVHAVEVAPSRLRNEKVAKVFRLFNRPARGTNCDCERPRDPSVPQSLYLMSDPSLLEKIRNGRLRRLLESEMSDGQVIDELFLATLSRFPNSEEKRSAREHIQNGEDRDKAYRDMVWALVNTREFITNH